ncbi:MAG TPA: hypothetical protein VNE39_11625 [Planctomycetota bacterium]|nr:hypothetical protein [Planctomycetota bacterium]
MTRQARSSLSLDVLSEWVRVDPVSGDVVDLAALRVPGAAALRDTDGAVRLAGARNEYVSFQVIVRNGGRRIRDVRLSFGGLAGPSGARIGRREFEPHVQWYHHVEPHGWIPDALVPLKWVEGSVGVPWRAAGVPKQTVQGFWIDLFVPPDSPPGPYQGQLLVALDGEKQSLPIRLEVWPFAVPDECSMVADMNAYAPGIVRGWEGHEHSPGLLNAWKGLDSFDACGTVAYRTAERNTFRCAHDHRSLYHYLPYAHSGSIPHPSFIPELAGEGKAIRVKSWAAFDQHFGGYLDGSAFKGTRRGPIPLPFMYTPQNFHWPADFAKFGRKGYRTEWRRVGAKFVEHFRTKGWTRTRFELFFNHKQRYKYFPWDGDEIKFLEDTDHMYLFRDLSAGVYDAADPVQFIWRVDSSWVFPAHCRTDLGEFVKLWVVNSSYQAEAPDGVNLLHERGCSVFHYGGASPLDAPLSWVWLWPLRTLGRGNDGFTWWLTTGWSPDIWRRSHDNYATCVFYPASPWGRLDVLGGIRAKALRNAMQTIEYAALLDRKRGPGTAIALVNQALGTSDDSWWGEPFPADPLSWEGVRRRLASALMA